MALRIFARAYRRCFGSERNPSDIPMALLRRCMGDRMRIMTRAGPLIIDLSDSVGGSNLLRRRVHEPNTSEFFQRLLVPGSRVLDIGANIGYFSVLCGRAVGESGQVISFEPSPRAVGILRDNLQINGLEQVVEVHQSAASDASSEMTLYLSPNHPGNNMLTRPERVGLRARRETVQVRVVRVDDVVDESFVADAIKIDVEGFEYRVLLGLHRVLERSPGAVIVCEVASRWLRGAGASAADVLALLGRYGCKPFRIGARGAVLPCQFISDDKTLQRLDQNENFVFARGERLEALSSVGRVLLGAPVRATDPRGKK